MASCAVSQSRSRADGKFLSVRTVATKSYEFITGSNSNWLDETAHDAIKAMLIHNDLQMVFDGQYNDMTFNDDSEYSVEWQENYEYIQGTVRLEQSARASSNKAI